MAFNARDHTERMTTDSKLKESPTTCDSVAAEKP